MHRLGGKRLLLGMGLLHTSGTSDPSIVPNSIPCGSLTARPLPASIHPRSCAEQIMPKLLEPLTVAAATAMLLPGVRLPSSCMKTFSSIRLMTTASSGHKFESNDACALEKVRGGDLSPHRQSCSHPFLDILGIGDYLHMIRQLNFLSTSASSLHISQTEMRRLSYLD